MRNIVTDLVCWKVVHGMGDKVDLGKKNWQLIVIEGSAAIMNRMDTIGLITMSFEQIYELARWT